MQKKPLLTAVVHSGLAVFIEGTKTFTFEDAKGKFEIPPPPDSVYIEGYGYVEKQRLGLS
jgi:hypothetical protein